MFFYNFTPERIKKNTKKSELIERTEFIKFEDIFENSKGKQILMLEIRTAKLHQYNGDVVSATDVTTMKKDAVAVI